MSSSLLSSPFYRLGDRGTEREVTCLRSHSGRARTQIQAVLLQRHTLSLHSSGSPGLCGRGEAGPGQLCTPRPFPGSPTLGRGDGHSGNHRHQEWGGQWGGTKAESRRHILGLRPVEKVKEKTKKNLLWGPGAILQGVAFLLGCICFAKLEHFLKYSSLGGPGLLAR